VPISLDVDQCNDDHRGTLQRYPSLMTGRLMMNSQFYADRPGTLSLPPGDALRLHGLAGELTVAHGRVWLTREDDLDDYVLEAGDHFMLAAGDVVVVERWQPNAPAALSWRPRRQALPRPGLLREVADLGRLAFA